MAVRRPSIDAALGVVLVAVCLALLLPFAERQNAWPEWTNYFWLLKEQVRSMRVLGHPTLFIHQDQIGLFYPQYVFYGGGLWTAAAALALALGSTWTAFVAVLALAVAAGYAGAWWVGAQFGLGRWAHAPAFAVVTSPYIVMGNLYGRGDWTEIVAVCLLPVAIAGALDLQRHARVRLRSLAAVTIGAAVVAASHPLTLFWGSIFAAGGLAVGAVTLGRDLRWDRLALAAGAAAVGVGLDAWYLVAGVSLAPDTRAYATGRGPLLLDEYNATDLLFSLTPKTPLRADRPLSSLSPQLPVLVGAWALAAGTAALRRGGRARRAWLGLATIVAVFLWLILNASIWSHLPAAMRQLQFAFRLQSYVVLAVAGLVVCGLVAVRASRWANAWRFALVLALAGQLAYCVSIARRTTPPDPQRARDVHATMFPVAFGGPQQQGFRFDAGPVLRTPNDLFARLPEDALRERLEFVTPEDAAGHLIATNVIDSPLVRFTGDAKRVGRDAQHHAVVRVGKGGRKLIVAPAPLPSVRSGRLLTLLSLACVAGAVGWRVRPGLRRRRRRRPRPAA